VTLDDEEAQAVGKGVFNYLLFEGLGEGGARPEKGEDQEEESPAKKITEHIDDS
jgi:hypothetical protein